MVANKSRDMKTNYEAIYRDRNGKKKSRKKKRRRNGTVDVSAYSK